MTSYEVTLRPAFSGGPNRLRSITADSLREAQDKAAERWPLHQVFFVREKHANGTTTEATP